MEDFVSFEIAKKLKEKGFREECLYCYWNKDGKLYANPLYGNDCETYITTNELLYSHNGKDITSRIDAPTISQVLKWLREKKKLHITTGYSNSSNWRYIIIHLEEYFVKEPNIWEKGFETCEQAAFAGIEYVLDELI